MYRPDSAIEPATPSIKLGVGTAGRCRMVAALALAVGMDVDLGTGESDW
jgi:hypothetical protein